MTSLFTSAEARFSLAQMVVSKASTAPVAIKLLAPAKVTVVLTLSKAG